MKVAKWCWKNRKLLRLVVPLLPVATKFIISRGIKRDIIYGDEMMCDAWVMKSTSQDVKKETGVTKDCISDLITQLAFTLIKFKG